MKVKLRLKSQRFFGKKGRIFEIDIDESFMSDVSSSKEVRTLVINELLELFAREELKNWEFV
jgi:hypothetical protein